MPELVPLADDCDNFENARRYKWLEEATGSELETWLEEKKRITEYYLMDCKSRQVFVDKLSTLYEEKLENFPFKRGNRIFRWLWPSNSSRGRLCFRDPGSRRWQILLDPNDIDGQPVDIIWLDISNDGTLLAFAFQNSELGRWDIRLRDITTRADRSLGWAAGYELGYGEGKWANERGLYLLFASRHGLEDENEETSSSRLVFHPLEDLSLSRVIVPPDCFQKEPGETSTITLNVDESGCFLILNRTTSITCIYDIDHDEWFELHTMWGNCNYLCSSAEAMYFRRCASNGNSLIEIRKDRTGFVGRTLIVEEGHRIGKVFVKDQRLVVELGVLGHSIVRLYDLDGNKIVDFDKLFAGSTTAIEPDTCSPFVLVKSEDLAMESHWRIDLGSGEHQRYDALNHDDEIRSKLAYVEGINGVAIPIAIARHGAGKCAPTIVFAYGGYGVTYPALYRQCQRAWIDSGGTWVHAQVRGGGGVVPDWFEWKSQGTGANKRNTLRDLQSVLRWLVDAGWSTPEQLGLYGISHGGWLMLAAMMHASEHIGAVVAESAPTDLLRRYEIRNKRGTATEYGDVESEDEFKLVLSLSPLHNIRPDIKYPPCLLIARELDKHVPPVHSFKFLAAMLEETQGQARVLLRWQKESGHFPPRQRQSAIAEASDWLAFFARELGLVVW